MEVTTKCRRHHRVFRILKLGLQAATLAAAAAAVYELERIHHRLGRLERRRLE
ncbi:MAG: hypothetical protein K2L62_02285 [Muribaculaceae bacterium]|nr:hypothetical protein [Muribaculaceae bacterium]